MKSHKHLLLTFDYELFLGSNSGSVENCILKPTDKILSTLKTYNVKSAIFFVDTTYLLRLKEIDNKMAQQDYIKVCNQLKEIKNNGHYIFPHLHPHWLDATYNNDSNTWNLSETKKYSFSSLTNDEKKYVFSSSVELLSEIIGEQQVLGYRAGGWCIQPFSDFKPFFEKHNIQYDFSVMNGYRCISDFQNFDFRKVPNKHLYKFSTDVLAEDLNGSFTEIPISLIKRDFLTKLINNFFIKLLYRKGISNYGDGFSVNSASVKEVMPGGYEMASIELLTLVNITDYIKKFEQRNFLHFISHPKMLTPHNIVCLDVFLKKILAKHSVNTDFKQIA